MFHPTPAQRRAIDHDVGNLLILACAGSGKTETIAQRIARMVAHGASRGSIIAFTFTEHAAEGLKQRIRLRLEEAVPDEPSLGDMYVGTIHSFCLRVLRDQDAQFRRFDIMDETSQSAMIAANFVRFAESGIGLDRLRSRTRSRTYGETLRTFLNTLNVIHQQGIDIDAIADPVLADAVSRYRDIAYKAPNYFFDFNKIIDQLIEYFRQNSVALSEFRQRLTHVFVDEYQDVDDRQEHLVHLLTNGGTGPHLTVVGDDDQALYGFRGARVQNILTFRDRYPDVHTVPLNDNFRSTHAIVSISDEAARSITSRIVKEPVARRILPLSGTEERLGEGGDIHLRTFSTEEDEASWTAQRIQELHGVSFEDTDGMTRGLDYGDMAILLRSVRNSGAVFADTLRANGIPVVIAGTRGLFNNYEIRLIQAAFSILARSDFGMRDDNGRFHFLTTVDTREFIRKTIASLRTTARLGEHANSTHFLSRLDQIRADLDHRSLRRHERDPRTGRRIYPQAIFHKLLHALGSTEDDWPVDVMFNFGAFSRLITQFESVHQWITPSRLKSLSLFLSTWATDNVDDGGTSDVAELNSVKIMTVHGAKGLEWPVVFLPRISSMVFPSSQRNRGPSTFLPPSVFNPSTYAGGDDGERRLWYVALTRCAKFLNISSLDRPRKRPTPYFREVVHDCVVRNGLDPTPRQKTSPTPPANTKLLPTTYSDLAAFWECEYQYSLRCLMDFSPGVGEQFGYGQQIHNILAEIHQKAIRGEIVDKPAIRSLVNDRFHLRYTIGTPLEAMREAAIRGLERYVDKYRSMLSHVRAIEKPFELIDAESGALISGAIDLLETVGGDTSSLGQEILGLVDFKSRAISSRKEYQELASRSADQLRLYALGARHALFVELDRAAVRIISHRKWPQELEDEGLTESIQIDVSTDSCENTRDKIAKTVGQIRNGITTETFRRTGVGNGHCRKCDFRVICKGMEEYRRANVVRNTEDTTPQESEEYQVDTLLELPNAGP